MRRNLRSVVFLLVGLVFFAILGSFACARAPAASFSANPTSGAAPLAVNFSDQSKNKPTQWNWDFGDGTTSNEQNPSHTYTKIGTYAVKLTATNNKGANTAQAATVITVRPGPLDKLTLEPATATLSPQGVQRFTAKAFDAFGNEIPIPLSWSAEPTAGFISPDGTFTAGTRAGTFERALGVEAAQAGVTRSSPASITVRPGPLDKLTLEPATATLNPQGVQRFSAKALDAFGNEIAVPLTWRAEPTAGTVSPEGAFNAGTKSGSYERGLQVEAAQAGVSRTTTASITVRPGPLDRVVVKPGSATLGPEEILPFTVQAFDAYGNDMTQLQTFWRVVQGGGTINESGTFTAGTRMGTFAGTVSVEVVREGVTRSATASITIGTGPLDKIAVTPASAGLDIGGSQQYQGKGFDRFGNEIADITVRWSTEAGSVDIQGLFTAGTKAGTFPEAVKAEASYRENTRAGTAAVTIRPGPLDRVTLEPASPTLAIQSTQQFAARALDRYGNEIPGITATWSLMKGGGTVDQRGVFSAGTVAGSYKDTILARAAQGAISREATASVVVYPGPFYQVALAPGSADIGIGIQQQFVAAGADQFGNRISGLTFTWGVEAGGGTIDAKGLFTAGTTPGTYDKTVKATATQGNITRSGTARVTVQPDRIAFLSERDRNAGEFDLYIMDVDGKNQKRLTTSRVSTGRLAFSSNGGRIAYSVAGDLVVMGDDGSWPLSLLSGSRAYVPQWSPDGSKIAFQCFKDDAKGEVYVMGADGGNVTRLTNNSAQDDYPTWSPDGKKIAFVSDRGGKLEIYVMNADGSDQRRLTT